MKKILVIFTMLATFASCKDRTAASNEETTVTPQKSQAVQQRVVYVDKDQNTATAKKGWSKAAKGAVIGGASGAIIGGVITKSGKGAVIGGVLGAGTGYVIGRSKDRKDGRVH
jgi:outer membrane lipoprotein SlyB